MLELNEENVRKLFFECYGDGRGDTPAGSIGNGAKRFNFYKDKFYNPEFQKSFMEMIGQLKFIHDDRKIIQSKDLFILHDGTQWTKDKKAVDYLHYMMSTYGIVSGNTKLVTGKDEIIYR